MHQNIDFLIAPEKNTLRSFSFDKPDSFVHRDKSERCFIKGYDLMTHIFLLKFFLKSSRNLFCASLFLLIWLTRGVIKEKPILCKSLWTCRGVYVLSVSSSRIFTTSLVDIPALPFCSWSLFFNPSEILASLSFVSGVGCPLLGLSFKSPVSLYLITQNDTRDLLISRIEAISRHVFPSLDSLIINSLSLRVKIRKFNY